jgi:ABC-type Fe3+-citrate transport system substrate-binding protein
MVRNYLREITALHPQLAIYADRIRLKFISGKLKRLSPTLRD